jgi:cytoskeletal protein CcmA (bactofilin family)
VQTRDAWNSQPEAQLFDEGADVVIKNVLDALPNGSAITFSADQLDVLFSGGGPVLADTKTASTILERPAHACGCSFALHGDTGTFTKNLIDAAATAATNVPRSPDSAANSSIGRDMTVVGKIFSEGVVVNVFGRVEGELHASIVWVSDGAQVEGTIAAQELTIGGRFRGTIQANRVTLTSSAVVEGEIHYRSLAIEENAWFAGVSHPAEASGSGTDARSTIQLVPADGNRQINSSLENADTELALRGQKERPWRAS